jgi:tetratricopeptide (TPR) repeat protein
LGRTDEALALIDDSLSIDAFNAGCRFERYLLTRQADDLAVFHRFLRGESHNYTELVADYASAGCWDEALAVTDAALKDIPAPEVIISYFKAWCLKRLHRDDEAKAVIRAAERQSPGCCFPNLPEAILALQEVVALVEQAPKAWYLLGNVWYDKRQYPEAIACWQRSLALDDTFPTTLRNLSLACFNKLDRKEEALALLEKAFALDTSDARVLMELDQLYKRLNRPCAERLAFLQQYRETAWKRDDVYLEQVTLLNQTGQHEEAIRLIDARKFHPWEGGEGKVPAQYQLARIALTKRHLAAKNYEEALRLVEECYQYPHNLGEGKLYGAQENDLAYYKGCALAGLGRAEEAQAYFEKASKGDFTLAAAMYYNDQKPDKIFYQGLALLQLGRTDEAHRRFQNLIAYGEQHVSDTFKMDYFAVSLPDLQIWEDDMDERNRRHCEYLMELGRMGLGE